MSTLKVRGIRHDTATTDAISIDSSNNVTFNQNVELSKNGTCLTVDRQTSDGTVIDVQKDGTTVGSIGVSGTNTYISGTSTGSRLVLDGTNNVVRAWSDDVTTLGASGQRFKNLYLSGGVYLGGTGSANYLDDYEEGTWTPAFGDTIGGYVSSYLWRYGYYTKIGRIVHVWGSIGINVYGGGITGEPSILGLPFTAANTTSYTHPVGSVMFWTQPSNTNWNLCVEGGAGPRLFFRFEGTTGDSAPNAASFGGGTKLSFSATFHVA